jgi:hypothetical protein
MTTTLVKQMTLISESVQLLPSSISALVSSSNGIVAVVITHYKFDQHNYDCTDRDSWNGTYVCVPKSKEKIHP